MTDRLLLASGGLIGLTMLLIRSAAEKAVGDGRILNPSVDLDAAYRGIYADAGTPERPNPFKVPAEDLGRHLILGFPQLQPEISKPTSLRGTAPRMVAQP